MDQYASNPIPTTNLYEIIAINELILNAKELQTLIKLYNRYGNYNHPQICYDFGRALLIRGDKVTAKSALLKGASYGLSYPCVLYDNAMIDSIGQCMFDLVTKYSIQNVQIAKKVTCLTYIYLSRCVELYHRIAYDSYRSRAILFRHHGFNMLPHSIVAEYLGPAVLLEPFIISDFYFSAMATDSSFRERELQSAEEVHTWLEDISVGGRAADEYSLEEISELGEARHFMLFKTLEEKYEAGEFDTTKEELHELNR